MVFLMSECLLPIGCPLEDQLKMLVGVIVVVEQLGQDDIPQVERLEQEEKLDRELLKVYITIQCH